METTWNYICIYMCGLCQQGSHFNLEAKERWGVNYVPARK